MDLVRYRSWACSLFEVGSSRLSFSLVAVAVVAVLPTETRGDREAAAGDAAADAVPLLPLPAVRAPLDATAAAVRALGLRGLFILPLQKVEGYF